MLVPRPLALVEACMVPHPETWQRGTRVVSCVLCRWMGSLRAARRRGFSFRDVGRCAPAYKPCVSTALLRENSAPAYTATCAFAIGSWGALWLGVLYKGSSSSALGVVLEGLTLFGIYAGIIIHQNRQHPSTSLACTNEH